jgi:hypothetical protein
VGNVHERTVCLVLHKSLPVSTPLTISNGVGVLYLACMLPLNKLT